MTYLYPPIKNKFSTTSAASNLLELFRFLSNTTILTPTDAVASLYLQHCAILLHRCDITPHSIARLYCTEMFILMVRNDFCCSFLSFTLLRLSHPARHHHFVIILDVLCFRVMLCFVRISSFRFLDVRLSTSHFVILRIRDYLRICIR